jgi:hypothetical protein
MATTATKATEAEREQRRLRDRERLKAAAEQLLTSEGWQRWISVRSRNGLSRYSFNNQLLIALSNPDASFVAGFRAWLELGYRVRKGERAIWIFAPMKVEERDALTREETGKTRTLFRAVPVFDFSQVDAGENPTPLEAPREPLDGNSHQHLLDPAEAFASSLGYTVSFESVDGSAGGWCDAKHKRIVVDAEQAPNAQLRVLIHESVHALGVDYKSYSRAQAEVIVDTTTLIVLGAVGLDISGETVPYVAGWGENGALEAVTEFAQLIDTLAKRVETAITPAESSPEDPKTRPASDATIPQLTR